MEKSKGYTGYQTLHKYWGKKPPEVMCSLIKGLTPEGGIVMDPFCGFGAIARETTRNWRKFTGFDVNPIAVRLAKLISSLPTADSVATCFAEIEQACRDEIYRTYRIADTDKIADWYLWEKGELQELWSQDSSRKREKHEPSKFDLALLEEFTGYETTQMRSLRLYDNPRINTYKGMTHGDLFTGRAQHNIDILLKAIRGLPESKAKEGMLLSFTAAIGQMSKMVFAITGRGKTTGKASTKIEVGSWQTGYWTPETHFEGNVWKCFERRVNKLIKACRQDDNITLSPSTLFVPQIQLKDCLTGMSELNDSSVDLIITDPPHGDRIPYLELSELWNSVLLEHPVFTDEIIISNAKTRGKGNSQYFDSMGQVFAEFSRILVPKGIAIVLYNSRKGTEWDFLKQAITDGGLNLFGKFLCSYSAGSIAQDSRAGGMSSDYALVLCREGEIPTESQTSFLSKQTGWQS